MKQTLTLNELEKMGACGTDCSAFFTTFGEKALISDVVKKLHSKRWSKGEGWLLGQNVRLTKAMLKHGANIHANRDRALTWAARGGNLGVIKILLGHGIRFRISIDRALNEAAEEGHFNVVALLLKRGADVHSAVGWWAIYSARKRGHGKIVRLLEKHLAKLAKAK